MDCACVYVEVDGCAECTTNIIRKANTDHTCGECKGTISKGEDYEIAKGKWEGEWFSHKTCLDCLSLRNVFFCSCWYYGEILYNLEEHVRESEGQISSDCIIDLTPRAADRVFKMIEEVWERLNDREDDGRHGLGSSTRTTP